MNRIVRAGLTLGFVLAIALAGSASAHNADASLNCSSEGVTLHVESSAYPNGSWFDYSIDGGAVSQVQTGLTINVNAGSPMQAHTAIVQFHSVDGKTQFNFTFNLASEACVQPTPVPTPTPTPTPTPVPTPTPTPVPTPTPEPTPSSSVTPTPSEPPVVTPTPVITAPPTATEATPVEAQSGVNLSLLAAALVGLGAGLYMLRRPGPAKRNRR